LGLEENQSLKIFDRSGSKYRLAPADQRLDQNHCIDPTMGRCICPLPQAGESELQSAAGIVGDLRIQVEQRPGRGADLQRDRVLPARLVVQGAVR